MELHYADHAAKGLIDDGPINDVACIYYLVSKNTEKKAYVSVLFGYMNGVYSTVGTLYLGNNITITNLIIKNNEVYVTFVDSDGNEINRIIGYDGELINFVG